MFDEVAHSSSKILDTTCNLKIAMLTLLLLQQMHTAIFVYFLKFPYAFMTIYQTQNILLNKMYSLFPGKKYRRITKVCIAHNQSKMKQLSAKALRRLMKSYYETE